MTAGDTVLRRDAATNRARLIAAAVDVFNDQGLDAGVEAIAQRAGVGVGTLYRRFPTKDALIEYLVGQVIDDLSGAADAARAVPDGRGLEQFVRTAADQLATHRGCLVRLWRDGNLHESEVDRLRARIDALVVDACAAGAVRPGTTRADITLLMWALQGVIENAGEQAHDACAWLITTAFEGLRPAT